MAVNYYKEVKPWYTITNCGPYNEEAFQVVTVKTVSTVDNPVLQRVRPERPLWESPTPLPLQSTTTNVVNEWVKTWGSSCYTTEWYYRDTDNLGNDITTNWQLPLRLKIKDVAVNLGTALVEYRATGKMFETFARGARDGFLRYKGLRKGRIKATPCNVAAGHLMLNYGIRPLASDLMDSVEVLNQRLSEPVNMRFTARAEDREVLEMFYNGYDYEVENYASDRVVVHVTLEPRAQGIIIGNPAELLWESIPFSFVVDWGINVGDSLAALDALSGVSNILGTRTHKRKSITKLARHYGFNQSGFKLIKPGKCTHETHERFVVTDIPLPELPEYKPSRSWKAIANGVALLTALNQRCQK